MASSLSARVGHDWAVTRPTAETRTIRWIVPVVLVGLLFQLATSDGGRHVPSLVFAQTVVFVLLAVVVWFRSGSIPLLRPLAAVVGVTVLGALVSVRPEASISQILLWLMYLGLVILVGSTITGAGPARRLLDAIVVVAGWVCLIALFNFWGAGNPQMRWYSTFYWPNPFAAFLLLVLPLQAVRMLRAPTAREAFAHGALAVLLAVSFILTYSRGAWLSLAAVAPVAAIILRPRSWGIVIRRAVLFALAVAAAVILLTGSGASRGSASPMTVSGRAASIGDADDSSLQGRLYFWRAGLRIFGDHPWLGTGPGTFAAVYPQYQEDPRFYARDAHNLYVQTLSETGVVGTAALAWFVSSLVVLWLRTLRRTQSSEDYPLVAGIGVGLGAFLLHSGLDMDWAFPAVPATAFTLIGVLGWYGRNTAAAPRAPHARRMWPAVVVTMALVVAAAAAQAGSRAHRAFVEADRHAHAHDSVAALADFEEAAWWSPLNGRYHASVAAAALSLPRPDVARATMALRRAMAVDRLNASYRVQLARGLMGHRSADPAARRDAEAELRSAIRLDPMNRPEAYRMLARLHLSAGRRGEAERVYAAAASVYNGKELAGHILLWPGVVVLTREWAQFLVAEGRIPDAIHVLRSLLERDPRLTAISIDLARLYRRLGRQVESCRMLIAHPPASPGEILRLTGSGVSHYCQSFPR